MNKYLIRNCPAILRVSEVCNSYDKALDNPCLCKDCTDCLLKQIVELCKDYPKNCEIEGNCIDNRLCSSCFFGGGCEITQDILELLDIQECE